MKQILKNYLVTLLMAVVVVSVSTAFAAEPKSKGDDKGQTTSKSSEDPSKPKRDWYPFAGIVSSVNKQANTISLKKKEGERVLKLDAKSELEIYGKPGTLSGVKVGDYAHGKLHKDSAGHEVITAAKFDKEAPAKAKETGQTVPEKAPAKTSK